MNNQVNVIIAGAGMGDLIASCALYDTAIDDAPDNGIVFNISRLKKDILTLEDVDECDLSGIQYAVNATLHDTEASFAFDEKCKKMGIMVIHAINLGMATFIAVEKSKGYPFCEVVKRGTKDFKYSLGKYISQYGQFWQTPVPWIDEAIEKAKATTPTENSNKDHDLFHQQSIGAWITAGYCVNILRDLAKGKEVKFFPKFYLSPLLEEL